MGESMTFTPGPWWKSYDLGTYEIRADGGVVVAKDCTKENAEAIASMPDMLAALLSFERAAQLSNTCEDATDAVNEWLEASNDAMEKVNAVLKRLRDAGVIAKAEESA